MWYIPSFRFVGDTTNGSIRMPASSQYDSNSVGFIPGPPSTTSHRFIRDLIRLIVAGLTLIGLGVKGLNISLITYTIYSQCLIYTNLFEINLPQYQRVISHWQSDSYGLFVSLLPPYHPIKVRNSPHKVKQNRFYFSTSYPHRRSRRYETMLHSPQNG
jgi:hypothetical protein